MRRRLSNNETNERIITNALASSMKVRCRGAEMKNTGRIKDERKLFFNEVFILIPVWLAYGVVLVSGVYYSDSTVLYIT